MSDQLERFRSFYIAYVSSNGTPVTEDQMVEMLAAYEDRIKLMLRVALREEVRASHEG